jgi:hypothetical protein
METTYRRTPYAHAAAAAALVAAALAAPAGAANYALIVNGDDTFQHTANVELATNTLRELGYADGNVHVVSDGRGLRRALATLAARLGPDDLLLLYTTGHGQRRRGQSTLVLPDGQLAAGELAALVFALPFQRLVYIGDQCYSGGFAEAFAAGERDVVAISGSDALHQARCEPFVRPLWRAATSATRDADGDGMVSVEEAYAVGAAQVRRALRDAPEANTQYFASGAARHRQNSFVG